MKNIAVGEKVPAGSPLNPLGPIKIPIGLPSLIHGGKPIAKIGTFASHGCVGLTNAQVKDFAKMLGTAGGKEVSDQTITRYLQNPEKTQVIKLDAAVPVELRYETIVVEDGKLYIYKDVYDQNTNTEENLKLTLAQNGVPFEDLSDDERNQALEALNAMSSRPQKQTPKATNATATPVSSPTTSNQNSKVANANEPKSKSPRKPISRRQKQVVLEVAALSGKGYPAPVNLDAGSGKPVKKAATAAAAR